MATYDTLYDGTNEKALSDWGFDTSCVGERNTMKVDTWEGTVQTANITDNPIFAFEQIVTIYSGRTSTTGLANSFSGGIKKFTGKRVDNPLSASASGQGVTYKFSGPYYDLENTPYQQSYKGVANNPYPVSEVCLFTSTRTASGVNVAISLGDAMQDILQWLLDQYSAQGMTAPFQYKGRLLNAGAIDLTQTSNVYNYGLDSASTIDPAFFAVFYPYVIERPMMCARALEKCLELSPRASISFDYSTTPPTINIGIIDNFTSVALPLFDGLSHKKNTLQRRDDLKARAVALTYRINNTINGSQVVDYVIDKWGPNGSNSSSDPSSGLRVITDLIDLQGFSVTYVTGHLDCELLEGRGTSQTAKRAWWSSRRGGEVTKLIDSRIRFPVTSIPDMTLTYATAGKDTTGANVLAGQELTSADYAFYTSRVVQGTVHAWMQLNSGASVKSIKVRATSAMTYKEYDVPASGDSVGTLPSNEATSNSATNGNVIATRNTFDHHVNLTITNGITGTYQTQSSGTPGETTIIGAGGIAQYLFNQLNILQYEGDYVKIAAAFDGSVGINNRLNLTNGRSEWATMNAQIQSIREDYGSHETSVKIGPAKHLSSRQLLSMFNMFRNRRTWFNPQVRSDNTVPSGGGQVDMPIATGGPANAVDGAQNPQQGSYVDYATQGNPASQIQGRYNADAHAITTTLAATSPTAVDSTPINVMQPLETKFCDSDGNIFYAVVQRSGYYTKPS